MLTCVGVDFVACAHMCIPSGQDNGRRHEAQVHDQDEQQVLPTQPCRGSCGAAIRSVVQEHLGAPLLQLQGLRQPRRLSYCSVTKQQNHLKRRTIQNIDNAQTHVAHLRTFKTLHHTQTHSKHSNSFQTSQHIPNI